MLDVTSAVRDPVACVSEWTQRAVSATDALATVTSGMTVFVHGAAATPTPLLDALAARSDLEGIALYHLHTSGPAPFAPAADGGTSGSAPRSAKTPSAAERPCRP